MLSWVERLKFPAGSAATRNGIVTITCPSAVGVTSNVNTILSELAKETPGTTPLLTEISVDVKPSTSSLNVAVTGIGDVFVGFVGVESATVGEVRSETKLSWLEASLVFPARSVATPSGISTVIVPSPDGRILNVYMVERLSGESQNSPDSPESRF